MFNIKHKCLFNMMLNVSEFKTLAADLDLRILASDED
jgi:hypothetical protein